MNFEGFYTLQNGMNAVRRGYFMGVNCLTAVRREIFWGVGGADCVSFKVLFRLGRCRGRAVRIFSGRVRVECSAARVFPA